jgi:hypothetical protein
MNIFTLILKRVQILKKDKTLVNKNEPVVAKDFTKIRIPKKNNNNSRRFKKCSQCGVYNTKFFKEQSYGNFKTICSNCVEDVQETPEPLYFALKCDICKGIEDLGMVESKASIFKVRCKDCAKI